MSACGFCAAWVGDDEQYCSAGCAEAATYQTLDEREIAFARDEHEHAAPDAA